MRNRLASFVILLSILLLGGCYTNSVREISQKRFMQMVKDHEIERVSIINEHTVEVRLTSDAIASTKYHTFFRYKEQSEGGKPHFILTIRSEKAFRDDLASLNPTFPITTEKRSLFGFKS